VNGEENEWHREHHGKLLAFTSGGLKREEQRCSEIGSALQSKHCPRNAAPQTQRR
jgi:hypothetical protein